jgi:hypothetical protein
MRKNNMYALGRLKSGERNKTEANYESHLKLLMLSGEIAWFKFEVLKFRLADKTFYTPDFTVMRNDGQIEFHEVTGFWLDDAKIKIKVASDLYPFKFLAIKAKAKKDGGGWIVENF